MNDIGRLFTVGFVVFIVSTAFEVRPAAAVKGCHGYVAPRPPFRGCVFDGVANLNQNPCHPANEHFIPTCTPSPLFVWKNCETPREYGTCKPYTKQ